MKLKIKPLSVNKAWQGRRFKTNDYKNYEQQVLLLLPNLEIPEGKLLLNIEVGFSSKASDLDNVLKPFIDILQKKYGFNDKDIYEIYAVKKIVKKGNEYIRWSVEQILQEIGLVK